MQVIDRIPYRKLTAPKGSQSIVLHGNTGGKFYFVIRALSDKYEGELEFLNGEVERLTASVDKRNEIIRAWEEWYAVADAENKTKLNQREDLEKKLARSEENNMKLQMAYEKLSSESRAEIDLYKTELKQYEHAYKIILDKFQTIEEKNAVRIHGVESQHTATKEHLRKCNSKTFHQAKLPAQESGNPSLKESQSSTQKSIPKSESALMRQYRKYVCENKPTESKTGHMTLQALQREKNGYQQIQMSTNRNLQENERMENENETLKLSSLKQDQGNVKVHKLIGYFSRLGRNENNEQN